MDEINNNHFNSDSIEDNYQINESINDEPNNMIENCNRIKNNSNENFKIKLIIQNEDNNLELSEIFEIKKNNILSEDANVSK